MTKSRLKRLEEMFMVVAPILALLSVVGVGVVASRQQAVKAVEEATRDLNLSWELGRVVVQTAGVGTEQVPAQRKWETMDLYCVDMETEQFASSPRFLKRDVIGTVECETVPFVLATAGQRDTGIHLDYRGVEVISAFGSVNSPTGKVVLLAEIDVREVVAGNKSWWLLIDDVAVGILAITSVILVITDPKELPVSRASTGSTEDYEVLLNGILEFPQGFLIVERTGHVRIASKYFCEEMGYLAAELKGNSINPFASDSEVHARNIANFFTSNDTEIQTEVVTTTRLGDEKPVRLQVRKFVIRGETFATVSPHFKDRTHGSNRR